MDDKKSKGVIVSIGMASSESIAHPITVSMRAYFSSYHLWSAKEFSKQAKKIEEIHTGEPNFNIKHQAFVISSILSSVAFAEAAINELYQDVYDGNDSHIGGLEKEQISLLSDYWGETEIQDKSHISTLEKYQKALNLCRKEEFNIGANPFQNVQLVIQLRNTLVHYKPESISPNDGHKLSNRLRNKFSENKLMSGSGNPYYPNKLLGHGCAEWAWKSIKDFTDKFFKRLSVEPHYKKAIFY